MRGALHSRRSLQVLQAAMRLLGMRADTVACKDSYRRELADGLGLSEVHIAALLDDTARVTPDLAIQLAERTGVPVSYWRELAWRS